MKVKVKGNKKNELQNVNSYHRKSNIQSNHVKLNKSMPPIAGEVVGGVNKRRPKRIPGTLRERMQNKLKSARFRYLNEKLYTAENQDINKIFTEDPSTFKAYHEGYRHQVGIWPINPLDVVISDLEKRCATKKLVVADFGCGDAVLALRLSGVKVKSFDLVAANERVTACDIRHTNLPGESIDVVVFCLALMGSSLSEFIKEANRVLKIGGLMKIAEVESRFDSVNQFTGDICKLGFELVKQDYTHNLFYFFDFKKNSPVSKKKKKNLPLITLKPCMYKKR